MITSIHGSIRAHQILIHHESSCASPTFLYTNYDRPKSYEKAHDRCKLLYEFDNSNMVLAEV